MFVPKVRFFHCEFNSHRQTWYQKFVRIYLPLDRGTKIYMVVPVLLYLKHVPSIYFEKGRGVLQPVSEYVLIVLSWIIFLNSVNCVANKT